MFLTTNSSAQTKKLSNNQVLQQKDSAFFQTQESRRIGDQLLLYQRDTGGWPKNVNMVVPLTATQKDSIIQQKTREDDSTIDNKATSMQMIFLARLYQQTKDDRYRDAFRKAMTFLLMQISKPDDRIIRAVNGAMKWFEAHKIAGYSWYNTEPQELYARYETWVKKNKITNRIIFE